MMDAPDVKNFLEEQKRLRDYYNAVANSTSASIELRQSAHREVERLNTVIKRCAKPQKKTIVTGAALKVEVDGVKHVVEFDFDESINGYRIVVAHANDPSTAIGWGMATLERGLEVVAEDAPFTEKSDEINERTEHAVKSAWAQLVWSL